MEPQTLEVGGRGRNSGSGGIPSETNGFLSGVLTNANVNHCLSSNQGSSGALADICQSNCEIKFHINGDSVHESDLEEEEQDLSEFSTPKSERVRIFVEKTASNEAKQKVDKILESVNDLTDLEKLLLYLKLPSGSSTDPNLSKPPNANPIGNRPEVLQSITWLQTHLQEDPEVSVPKQEIYEMYKMYCAQANTKHLSMADFGKVIKFVFPSVRPRRLGTRGKSRYCYSGLRKRITLEAPLLPDLSHLTFPANDSQDGYTETRLQHDPEIMSSVSHLIREWAEKLLTTKFESLSQLASFLVENLYVDTRSVAAFTVAALVAKRPPQKGGTGLHSPGYSGASSTSTMDGAAVGLSGGGSATGCSTPGGTARHRETQMQLQRKLQERGMIREQRRKLQEQRNDRACSDGKRSAGRPRSGRVSKTQSPICADIKPMPGTYTPEKSLDSLGCPNYLNMSMIQSPGDHRISRMTSTPKLGHSFLSHQHPSTPSLASQSEASTSPVKKYKTIQPKPFSLGEGVFPLTGARTKRSLSGDVSILSSAKRMKDAGLTFMAPPPEDPNQSRELCQLRQLLEQNLNPKQQNQNSYDDGEGRGFEGMYDGLGHTVEPSVDSNSNLVKAGDEQLLSYDMDQRRVSFESSGMKAQYIENNGLGFNSMPQSPTTKHRHFAFTPISPRHTPSHDLNSYPNTPQNSFPPSPAVYQHRQFSAVNSQPQSQTNSPFVSPRSTPVPHSRSRNNSGQQQMRINSSFSTDMSSSVGSSPFVSPHPTPAPLGSFFSRSRHNSTQSHKNVSFAAPASPNVSYGGLNRSRHSSGVHPHQQVAILQQPKSAPMSPNNEVGQYGGWQGDDILQNRARHMSANIPLRNTLPPIAEPSVLSFDDITPPDSGDLPKTWPLRDPMWTAANNRNPNYFDPNRRRHESVGAVIHHRPPNPSTITAPELCQLLQGQQRIANDMNDRCQSVPLYQMMQMGQQGMEQLPYNAHLTNDMCRSYPSTPKTFESAQGSEGAFQFPIKSEDNGWNAGSGQSAGDSRGEFLGQGEMGGESVSCFQEGANPNVMITGSIAVSSSLESEGQMQRTPVKQQMSFATTEVCVTDASGGNDAIMDLGNDGVTDFLDSTLEDLRACDKEFSNFVEYEQQQSLQAANFETNGPN